MLKRSCDRCLKDLPSQFDINPDRGAEDPPPNRATISIGLVKDLRGGHTSTDVEIEGDLCMECFAIVRDVIHYKRGAS